jgi:hypothetical protein
LGFHSPNRSSDVELSIVCLLYTGRDSAGPVSMLVPPRNRIRVDQVPIRDMVSAALFEQNPNPVSDRARAKREMFDLFLAMVLLGVILQRCHGGIATHRKGFRCGKVALRRMGWCACRRPAPCECLARREALEAGQEKAEC